jgi:hypothetical protein
MPRTPMARFSKSIKTAISGSSERVRPVALKRWPSWDSVDGRGCSDERIREVCESGKRAWPDAAAATSGPYRL